MKLNEVMHIYEKNIQEIIRDYAGLRDAATRALKSKQNIENVVTTWLGGMEGTKDIIEIINGLKDDNAFKNDKLDAAIIKIMNVRLAEIRKEENDAKKVKSSAKAIAISKAERLKRRDQTIIDKGKLAGVGY